MGKPHFNSIVKLTMRGESKYGLYTQYKWFLHVKTVFDAIIDRIGELELKNSPPTNIFCFRKTLKEDIKTPKEQWQKHYKILTWEYGKHHLKQQDGDI